MQFYNTIKRQVEEFIPRDESRVTMYVCGPTVYSFAHIGNARPAVVFDVVFRLLCARFGENAVIYARNITDVDDKINNAAKELHIPISTITEKYTDIYRADMAALGVLPPTLEPKVTDNIPAIIAQIGQLLESGHAYEAEGNVLFHVPSFADYGALSGRNRDDMIAGARVDVAPYKKDPADFVLWKPSDPETVGWQSPWGRGRPGWHIECSSMIAELLGMPIDIHGGGHDLIFPHHENELAQGMCSHADQPFAKYWMHNGFLMVEGEKMSKSIGNVLLVHDLLQSISGEVIRATLLSSHYRQPLDWTQDTVAQTSKALDRWYGALRSVADVVHVRDAVLEQAFYTAIHDDLNTPLAFSVLHEWSGELYKETDTTRKAALKGAILSAGAVLGLLQSDPEQWFQGMAGDTSENTLTAEQIDTLIAERAAAKKNKNFPEADRIRNMLTSMNILLEDKSDGTVWRRIR